MLAYDIIFYVEKHRMYFQKLLELISEFNKDAGYKTSIQKPIVFLYTNSEYMDIKIKNIIPLTIT